ncbi:MAG: teichoic acid biosynthesis protein [Myxococcales bacterium]|nr:teichoic acid biosynthesis protein [Myxococcales bacterium]
MKILYGVVGEGMGHATRSSVILKHLVSKHQVRVVVSGRAHAYLKQRFADVVEIEGLKMAYQDNEVDRSKTFWDLLKRIPTILSGNRDHFIELGESFRPDAVISDFESFAYMFGKHHELPVISIDNMQIINRCQLDQDVIDEAPGDFRMAKTIVKAKLPGCYHYMITSFFFPPVRRDRTTLYPPILRDEILAAKPTRGEHLIVYQTTTTNERLLDVLGQSGVPCKVYGLNRDETIGNLQLRPFSLDGFVKDLASCRGVLATGGYSLMGEAIYLGKPLLAVPLKKQFEQLLNALYLQKLGYGEYHQELSAEAVTGFVANLEQYEANLANYSQDGNNKILGALDGLLAKIEAEGRE